MIDLIENYVKATVSQEVKTTPSFPIEQIQVFQWNDFKLFYGTTSNFPMERFCFFYAFPKLKYVMWRRHFKTTNLLFP